VFERGAAALVEVEAQLRSVWRVELVGVRASFEEHAAESQRRGYALKRANDLLAWWLRGFGGLQARIDATIAHLAAQPATAQAIVDNPDAAPSDRTYTLPAAQPATAPIQQGWDVDDLVGKPATAPDLSRFDDVRSEPSCYAEQLGLSPVGQPVAPTRTEAEPNQHLRGCICARCEAEQGRARCDG
jgi:hypothetical protein